MDMENLEKRMYSFNLYNTSGIQCGIQSAHSNMEYALKYWTSPEFQDWAINWKTVILLNGGTSNSGLETKYGYQKQKGRMEQILDILTEAEIEHAPFYEPDLNYSLTSISFIVDERIFNKTKYPDPEINEKSKYLELYRVDTFSKLKAVIESLNVEDKLIFKQFINSIGEEKNLFLRFFLKDFRLSSN